MGKPVRTVRRINRVGRVLLVLFAAALAAFLALEGIVLAGSRSDLRGVPEAVIILGCKLWGEEPSPALARRLDAALDYLEDLKGEEVTPLVVVSGGQGDDEPMPEADCMAEYLEAHGVPAGQIIREDESTNTVENLQFSMARLREHGLEGSPHVTIVSNDFHLARVRMLAGRYGIDCSTVAAPTPDWPSRIYSNLREAPALVKSFLLD